MRLASVVAPLVALAVLGFAAEAAAPTLLGASKAWSAYQAATANGKVCYALAKPRSVEPRKAVRDPIFLMVSNWPDRKVQGEVQVVPGYTYKEGDAVTAQVGSTKVELFTRNNGTSGSAWVKDPSEEANLVEAMKKGSIITVSGVSERGTRTRDTYSLSGISAALDTIRKACGQ